MEQNEIDHPDQKSVWIEVANNSFGNLVRRDRKEQKKEHRSKVV